MGRKLLIVAVALCLLMGSTERAPAFTFWTNANGSGDFFDWSEGGSDNGMFGDPQLVDGDTWLFFPEAWRAESADGVPDSANDRMQVNLSAHQGQVFTSIRIREAGDYGILGDGAVSASGSAFAANTSSYALGSGVLVTNPTMPVDVGDGPWEAETVIDLDDWVDFTLVFDNNLLAISGAGSISFIEKKVVAITFTPEPGSLLMLASGGLMLIRRRSR
jgi:hypothetical protein